MISSTSCGSFVAYTARESPTSKLNPHPLRSSSKWRVSLAESGPLRRRLTRSLAGNGFVREYGGAATEASACIRQTMSAYRRQSRSAQAYSKSPDARLSTRQRRTFSATPAFSRLLRCERDREIHLSFESVDADNKHGQLIADTKAFTRPSPHELPPS